MKTIIELLEMETADVLDYVKRECNDHFDNVVTDDDMYVFAQGNMPIMFVAHIDTVNDSYHPTSKKSKKSKKNKGKSKGSKVVDATKRFFGGKVFESWEDDYVDLYDDEPSIVRTMVTMGNKVENQYGVLGADDRAGVYGLIKIMKHYSGGDMPSFLFTNYEESGGIGVKSFLKGTTWDGSGINLMVELDRRGCNEYVSYTPLAKEVEDYIESFGFVQDHGSYSDIADLSRATKIPSVNLSIGYYYQHTSSEYLMLDEMEMTINRCMSIVDNPIEKLYENPKEVTKSYGKYSSGMYAGDIYGYGSSSYHDYSPSTGIIRDNVIDIDDEQDDLDKYIWELGLDELLYEMGFISEAQECTVCGLYFTECSCGMIHTAINDFVDDDVVDQIEDDLMDLAFTQLIKDSRKSYPAVDKWYVDNVDFYTKEM